MKCLTCGSELATLGPRCLAGLLDTQPRLEELRALADGLHAISEGLKAATEAIDRILNAPAVPFRPAGPPDPD